MILCIQENPNIHINKEKTEKERKELSLEIRKQIKIIWSTLPTSSLFLNVWLLGILTDCGDHSQRFFQTFLICILTYPDSLVKGYLDFSSCCIVFWLEKLTIRNLIYTEKRKRIKNLTALTIVYKNWQPKTFLPLYEKHLKKGAPQFLS